ncbi:hypothetical protein IRJ41_008756 [Triplophysa rosa]|uniref:Uncharacterized protein n=2 Tax=Triplophysa rosa TaxID=992332 RepID=A0A9W7TEN9_TRIRA|nr:hypothetical protein IRJ41_008756 [Triplophysa rosa]
MRVTENRESTPLSQNCALNVRPPSVNGAYDSSSTSSESPEGSLADISSSSQRYTSLHYRCKDMDYINISEGTLDLNNKKSCDIDYENVTEPQKKITEKDQKNSDDGNASDSSDTSVESAVHYTKVVFPKADK